MTPEEFAEAVAAAVRQALSAPPLPRLAYTTAEAAEITGLSARWIEDQAAAAQIPSRKFGKSRRYSWDDLVFLVEAAAEPPTSGPYLKAFKQRTGMAA